MIIWDYGLAFLSRKGQNRCRVFGSTRSMSNAVTHPREVGPAPKPDSPKPEEIRRQLQRILASPVFHGSKRCQQFLEYVCEQSLTGGVGALKERTIAIEVFGRQPQSDLGGDTIVRVGAREVRKRLAQFYVTPEGAASEIRIDLHPGAYSPEFRYVTAHPEEHAAPVGIAMKEPARARRGMVLACMFAVLVASAVSGGPRFFASNPNNELFLRFWGPILRAPEPLLVAVAHPIVYHVSRRAQILSEENLPPQEIPLQRPVQLPASQMDGSDLV